MPSASAIMKKKAFIRDEMIRQFGPAQGDALWSQAQARLEDILRQYAEIPKGEHLHTDNYIFPAAALYLTIKEEIDQETAYSVIENASIRNSASMGKTLAGLMRIPGMRSLFIAIWGPMTRRMFGPKQGFQNVFYPKKKGEFRMDITACPYCKYFADLACPELTRVFCANDDRCYGSLPGLEFKRTGTLGTGFERCDFYMKKV